MVSSLQKVGRTDPRTSYDDKNVSIQDGDGSIVPCYTGDSPMFRLLRSALIQEKAWHLKVNKHFLDSKLHHNEELSIKYFLKFLYFHCNKLDWVSSSALNAKSTYRLTITPGYCYIFCNQIGNCFT